MSRLTQFKRVLVKDQLNLNGGLETPDLRFAVLPQKTH